MNGDPNRLLPGVPVGVALTIALFMAAAITLAFATGRVTWDGGRRDEEPGYFWGAVTTYAITMIAFLYAAWLNRGG